MPRSAIILFGLFFLALGAGVCRADGLRSLIEYDFALQEIETTTPELGLVKTQTDSLRQRYRIDAERHLYPALTARIGGQFERNDFGLESDGESIESYQNRTSPYLNLQLSTYPYQAGIGFLRTEDKQQSGTAAESVRIREQYHGNLSWRPEDLPSASLLFFHSETYDERRVEQDVANQRVNFNTRYQVTPELLLDYQAGLESTKDHLNQVETEQLTQSVRIDYADRFWNERTKFTGSYILGQRHSQTVASGEGEVEVPPLFLPATGLFALDDIPEEGELASSSVHVNDPDNSIGITLIQAPGELIELRNIGLEFPVATRMNTLRISVDATENLLAPGVDRQELINAFDWRVFTSGNGVNWTARSVTSVDFGPFQSRFEIRFPEVSVRFVKVVVAPLAQGHPLALRFPDFQVTRLEATLFLPAADAERDTTTTSHNLSLNAKTRLLDTPLLSHVFTLFYTASEPGGSSRTFISNGLTLQHRFKPTLTGSAQVYREDSIEESELGNRVDYRWGATLLAKPLPTLVHTLSYSGRLGHGTEGSDVRHSLYLGNRAALYQGVDLLFNAGVTEGENEFGRQIESYQVLFGASVTPHRSMTLDLSISFDRSEARGGGQLPEDNSNDRKRASISWSPLETLSLFVALEEVNQEGRATRTLRDLGANWSPFRGGTLQLQTTYSETLRPEEDALDRSFVPSILWKVRQGTVLSLSYTHFESESVMQTSTSQGVRANLRMNLL